MTEPDENPPEPGRELPPAGNGSLGDRSELPLAVPSALFLADRSEPAPTRSRRAVEPVAENVEDLDRHRPAVVEAGPFAGLADLDAFERRLAAVPGVASLRLRNFADGRAEFEVELADTGAPLQRQLRERLPDALVGLTPAGLRIDLEVSG